MRLTLAVLIAAVGGLLLMFVLTSKDEGPQADLQRRGAAGEMPTVVKPPDQDPVEVAGAHGTNVFTPRPETVTLDDGAEVTYGALLVWCASFHAITDEKFRVEDVRVLRNDKPKTRADLDSHVVVPQRMRPEHIGDLLSDAMGGKATGLRATTAIFSGGRNLQTAHTITMQDGVTIDLFDPADPKRTGKIECSSLLLELDNGTVVRGSTEDKVVITTSSGVIRGRGLSFVTETGILRIEQEISGDLTDLALVDRKGPPATVTAKGPLIYQPQDASMDRAALRPAGSFTMENDISIVQGEYALKGRKLEVRTRRGRSSVVSFDLLGAVSAETPQGTFQGERVTWTRPEPGAAKLVLEGAPITATLKDAARALPGIGAQGDLDISTDGTIVFTGIDRPKGEDRKIAIGPVVAMTGRDGARVDSRTVELLVRHVASNRAGAVDGDSELYPVRVVLAGDVRGQGPSGSFSCGTLEYQRTIDAKGRPTKDRVRLIDGPVLRYVPTAATVSEVQAPDPQRVKDLLSGPGPLHIRADKTLVITLDPMRTGPIEAEARGAVRVQRFDSKSTDLERGRLHAEEVDLVLVERFSPDLESVGVRMKSTRRVRHAAARRDVHVSIPDRIQGDGDVLTWDGEAGDLRLMRPIKKPAVVVVTDRKGRKQVIRAPNLLYRQSARLVEATGGVRATVRIPLIAYGTGRSSESIDTDIAARSVTAWLEAEGKGGSVTELMAQGAVVVKQAADAGIVCDHIRLDLVRDESIVRGSPARLDFIRLDDARRLKEWVIAPTMVVTDGEALLSGPVKARLHSKSKGIAMNVAGERRASSQTATLVPVDIAAEGDLYLSQDRIQARGPATVTQGDHEKDGFKLTSNGDQSRIVLFLEKSAPAGEAATGRNEILRKLDVTRAIVEGAVEFVSPDLQALGDVIEFDRDEKVITLYRHKGGARLFWQGQWQVDRPRFDLHLKDPDNPRVISTLTPPVRGGQ